MFKLVYVTCPDMAMAKHLAQIMLQARVIACANILQGMTSLYHWQGALEESSEVLLLCKTDDEHIEDVKSLVLAHHPYDCPCVLVMPIEDGNPLFLDWMKKELQKD